MRGVEDEGSEEMDEVAEEGLEERSFDAFGGSTLDSNDFPFDSTSGSSISASGLSSGSDAKIVLVYETSGELGGVARGRSDDG